MSFSDVRSTANAIQNYSFDSPGILNESKLKLDNLLDAASAASATDGGATNKNSTPTLEEKMSLLDLSGRGGGGGGRASMERFSPARNGGGGAEQQQQLIHRNNMENISRGEKSLRWKLMGWWYRLHVKYHMHFQPGRTIRCRVT